MDRGEFDVVDELSEEGTTQPGLWQWYTPVLLSLWPPLESCLPGWAKDIDGNNQTSIRAITSFFMWPPRIDIWEPIVNTTKKRYFECKILHIKVSLHEVFLVKRP